MPLTQFLFLWRGKSTTKLGNCVYPVIKNIMIVTVVVKSSSVTVFLYIQSSEQIVEVKPEWTRIQHLGMYSIYVWGWILIS